MIEQSFFQNFVNINSTTPFTSSYRSDWIPPLKMIVRNVRHAAMPGQPLNAIYRSFMPSTDYWRNANLTVADNVFVCDFNGTAGENYQVFYYEQRPDFILSQSRVNGDGTEGLTACRAGSMSNTECFQREGRAAAGSIAPCLTDGRARGIRGYTCSTPALNSICGGLPPDTTPQP